MRKALKFFLSALLTGSILVSAGTGSFAEDIQAGNNVNINGQRLYFDVPTISLNQRTMVPLRGVFEKLGADVEWVQNEQRVIIHYKDTIINLQQYNSTALVNGVEKQMDVQPIAYNGRTMIPLRFISENLGMWVQWIQEGKLATITEPGYFENLPKNTVLGFTTNDYIGDTSSHSTLTRNSSEINSIATFSHQVQRDGSLKMTGESQRDTVKFANTGNIKPMVLVHNFYSKSFDRNLAHMVLADPQKRQNLINNIITVMSREEYAGVNIDLENLSKDDRDNYSALIKQLKETLTPYGFLTTVSIPAKTQDGNDMDNWGAGFDYDAIGKYADKVMIMTYDEHYFGGNAGPIASYPWVRSVMDYATQKIVPNKILLGIAGYGYDWSDQGASVVTFSNVGNVMAETQAQAQWDDTMKSPYFTYNKNGVSHQVWYENSESIALKLGLVKEYGLGGIGIWRLGYDNDEFWNTISQSMG